MKRDPRLDGIRGVAVLLVVLYHAHGLLPGGWLGVQVFFVLSGFLITRLLLAERRVTGTVDRRAFYLRRVRRLAPALAVLLVAWLALTLSRALPVHLLSEESPPVDRLLATAPVLGVLTLTYNWLPALRLPTPVGMGHLWTLSVEEQFYLLLPTVVLLARGRLVRLLLGGAVAGSLMATAAANVWASRDFVYFSTPTAAIGILLGAFAAARPPTPRAGRGGAALVLVLLCAVLVGDTRHALLSPSVVVVSLATIILIVNPTPRLDRVLAGRPLAYTGRRSYAIYLWNSPLAYALGAWGLRGRLADAALVVGSFALAELSWRHVERRFVEPRQRRGRAAPALAPAAAET